MGAAPPRTRSPWIAITPCGSRSRNADGDNDGDTEATARTGQAGAIALAGRHDHGRRRNGDRRTVHRLGNCPGYGRLPDFTGEKRLLHALWWRPMADIIR